MAIQSWTVCSTEQASIGITYDDVSLVVQTLVLTNNQTNAAATLTVELRSFTDNSLIFSGTRAFGSGTASQNVAAHGWLVTLTPSGKPGGGIVVGLPVRVLCSWS